MRDTAVRAVASGGADVERASCLEVYTEVTIDRGARRDGHAPLCSRVAGLARLDWDSAGGNTRKRVGPVGCRGSSAVVPGSRSDARSGQSDPLHPYRTRYRAGRAGVRRARGLNGAYVRPRAVERETGVGAAFDRGTAGLKREVASVRIHEHRIYAVRVARSWDSPGERLRCNAVKHVVRVCNVCRVVEA